MNWKLFSAASVSLLLTFFPQNLIGCADGPDPYDYFSSFFSRAPVPLQPGLKPFYYTSLLRFYDEWLDEEPVVEDPVLAEWKAYGRTQNPADARALVYGASIKEVETMLGFAAGKNKLSLPDTLARNTLVQALLLQKKTNALEYLRFAKSTEAFSYTPSEWDNPAPPDSAALNLYILEAGTRHAAALDPFLKTKYAFQKARLLFYNRRYAECIRWYDRYLSAATGAAVRGPSLSYRAGSLFRLGRLDEAALDFSRVFALSGQNKKSAFLGFSWSTGNADPARKDRLLRLCKDEKEQAVLTALFALQTTGYRLPALENVLRLDPSSPLLPLLAIREVNKLEERYLTPLLSREKGGASFYTFLTEDTASLEPDRRQAVETIAFFIRAAERKDLPHRPLYLTGAAYLAYVIRDHVAARRYLAEAGALPAPQGLKDQQLLIRLLVMANEANRLDAAAEAQLVPAANWLLQKAKTDKEYRSFARNFFAQLLAQRYEQQGDAPRAALVYGAADNLDTYASYTEWGQGINYIREKMTTPQLLALYELMGKAQPTAFEKLLTTQAAFNRDAVVDVLGTSYLRDHDYVKAIDWLGRAKSPDTLQTDRWSERANKWATIYVDPLFDYLNDPQRYDKVATKPYTKKTLAEKLLSLQRSLDTARTEDAKSKIHYRLASAYYNMSHYGNSWMAVAWYRSSSDWNNGRNGLPWQKDHFEVRRAHDQYQKAYELARDPEFKAAAFFMMAKCAQRQIARPDYAHYPDWDAYDAAYEQFQQQFRTHPHLGRFQEEFGSTRFYRYTYNRCSYLRDFVNGK